MRSTTCSRLLRAAGTAAVLVGGVAFYLGVSAGWREHSRDAIGAAAASPVSADAVVLAFDGRDRVVSRLATLKTALKHQPRNAETAARYATLALQHYASSGDARFLGYADGALSAWDADDAPPAAIWQLRARIRQTQHRFAEAAKDLDRLLVRHPESTEAALLAADAWRRAGDLARSKNHCARLAIAGRQDLARYCAADVLLSLGQAPQAAAAVAPVEDDVAAMQKPTARWALAVAGEVMAANGRYSEARQLYESALRDGGADIALQVAYADLLLDTSRPAEALLALADQPETDAVLIRRAIAARALHDPRFDAWRRKLEGRFATAAMLGVDALHMRERALFELRVAGDPNSALRFALDNWARQKGREDALLLQQAARTAGRPDVAQVVDDWRSRFTSAGREAG